MLIDVINFIGTLLLFKITKFIFKLAETLQSDLRVITLLGSLHNTVT